MQTVKTVYINSKTARDSSGIHYVYVDKWSDDPNFTVYRTFERYGNELVVESYSIENLDDAIIKAEEIVSRW